MFQGILCRGLSRSSCLHRHILPITKSSNICDGICAVSSSNIASSNIASSNIASWEGGNAGRSIRTPADVKCRGSVSKVDGATTNTQLVQSIAKRGFCAKAVESTNVSRQLVKDEDLVGWNPETRDLYRQYAEELVPSGWEEIMCSAGREGNQELFSFSHPEFGATFEYVVFANRKEKRSITIMQFGDKTQGAPGFVHGGAIATAADECAGFIVNGILLTTLCMTGNINISYKKAIPLGTTVVIETHLEKSEGRKHYTVSTFKSPDDSLVYTIVNSLFIELVMSP